MYKSRFLHRKIQIDAALWRIDCSNNIDRYINSTNQEIIDYPSAAVSEIIRIDDKIRLAQNASNIRKLLKIKTKINIIGLILLLLLLEGNYVQ